MTSRLEGWNRKILSKAGKAVLIKLVAQAIPTYIMSMFRVPTTLCKDLDRLVKRFWWSADSKGGRYLALKSWDDICKPKDAGGLGFQKFSDINWALLAKLAWKVAIEEDSLWMNILRKKYLRGHSFFHYATKPGDLSVWKGIVGARQWIMK